MKKYTFVALLLVGILAFAQEKTQNHQRGTQGKTRIETADKNQTQAKRLEQMKQDLSLSDDQVTKIKALDEKYAQQQKEALGKSKEALNDSRNKMTDLKQQKENELKSVLTKDQATKYETLKSQETSKFKDERGEFRGQRRDSVQSSRQTLNEKERVKKTHTTAQE
jgi:Spy/CpxP family protein refolding chaperone